MNTCLRENGFGLKLNYYEDFVETERNFCYFKNAKLLEFIKLFRMLYLLRDSTKLRFLYQVKCVLLHTTYLLHIAIFSCNNVKYTIENPIKQERRVL